MWDNFKYYRELNKLEKGFNPLDFVKSITIKSFSKAVKPIWWLTKKSVKWSIKPKNMVKLFYAGGAYQSAQEGVQNFYKLSEESMYKKASLIPKLFEIGFKSASNTLSGALMGAGVAGVNTGSSLVTNKLIENRARRVFQKVLRDPEFANADKKMLEQFFETILKFAPKVAIDPVLLKNYLKQAMVYGTVDVNTIKNLQEVQKNMIPTASILLRKY